ncbi:MAG TPA: aminomethyl-transferring glycine dehydrogenase subunit GcvPA [Acidobacteria bacterium]|nr:aminomethyl-transferring glycine dehydrogenase subunit GcvPA [Acidobacteriota bacterium]
MLERIGVSSIDELTAAIPEDLRLGRELDLPAPSCEAELLAWFRSLAAKNLNAATEPCFLGAGVYQHGQPTAVDHLLNRGEFFTSYTPYQPEISQGTLQAIFEFQTMVCSLTGLDVSQASLYQGAAAFVEGLLLARRVQRRGTIFLVPESVHPHYVETLRTYLAHLDFTLEVVAIDPVSGRIDEDDLGRRLNDEVIALAVQSPNFYGVVERTDLLARRVHDAGALLVAVFNEPYSLGLLRSPGDLGADIAAGEFQAFASPAGFGGPHVGVLAAREKMMRQMPGRIVGETQDCEGRRGFVLTLSTREQHIRREKATSNVCTNSGLMALASTIHLCLLGKQGLALAADLCRRHAALAIEKLTALPGVERIYSGPVFNEFALRFPLPARQIAERLAERGILAPVPLDLFDPSRENDGLLALTELTGPAEIDRLAVALGEVL